MIQKVKTEDFASEVLRADKPVLVDFGAPWCVFCRRLEPAIERVSLLYSDKIKFVRVDTDESPEIARKYGVEGIPVLFIFKDGKVLDSAVNPGSQNALTEWLAANKVI